MTRPSPRARAVLPLAAALLCATALARPARADTTLTIATVNNGDMIVMQQLTPEFERTHPGIRRNNRKSGGTLEADLLRIKGSGA